MALEVEVYGTRTYRRSVVFMLNKVFLQLISLMSFTYSTNVKNSNRLKKITFDGIAARTPKGKQVKLYSCLNLDQ